MLPLLRGSENIRLAQDLSLLTKGNVVFTDGETTMNADGSIAINKDSATPMQDVVAVMRGKGLLSTEKKSKAQNQSTKTTTYTYEQMKNMIGAQVKAAYAEMVSKYAECLKNFGYTEKQVKGYVHEALKTKTAENRISSVMRLQEEMWLGMEGNILQGDGDVKENAKLAFETSNEYSSLDKNKSDDQKDMPQIGEKITDEQHSEFQSEMKEIDVIVQGFEAYCGEIEILHELTESIKQMKKDFPALSKIKNGVLLQYEDLNDPETFADSKGKTIRLNKYYFDDSNFLRKEYQKQADEGHFVRGTDYKSVIYHEMGHVLNKQNPALLQNLSNLIYQMNGTNSNVTDYIINKISKYGSVYQKGYFPELLSELLSACYNSKNTEVAQFASNILTKINLR